MSSLKPNHKVLKYFLCIFLFAGLQFVQAQSTPSITVTGEASFNLSPDEIIILISYEEYFTDANEALSSKVLIEDIEQKVLTSLKAAKIKDDKIAMGAATLVRPRVHQKYLRRRINKSLSVCISNTEEYLLLIRQFEQDGLFDREVTSFRLSEYRHTERERYEKECQQKALVNARAKAQRIASQSGRKLGKVMSVTEKDLSSSAWDASTYEVTSSSSGTSGFKGIPVSYALTVVFELVD